MQEKRKPRRGDNYESNKKQTRITHSQILSCARTCTALSKTIKHRVVRAHAAKLLQKRALSDWAHRVQATQQLKRKKKEPGRHLRRRRRLGPRHHKPSRRRLEPRRELIQHRRLEPRHHGPHPPRCRARPAGADSSCPKGVGPSRRHLDSGGKLPES